MLRSPLAVLFIAGFLTLGQPLGAGSEALASTEQTAAVACAEGGCPTSDPNVDCWTDGVWYYNKCQNACTIEPE
jgi:hypothetical protein